MQKSTKHFSIPIEKEVIKIDKDGNEIVITISFKIKFIDSARQIHDQNLLLIYLTYLTLPYFELIFI